MTDLLIHPESSVEPRTFHVADRPIDFDSWLSLTHDLDTELIKGVMIDRMAAQYPHEWIQMWFASILRTYTRNRKLGVVLGSRTAVKIDRNDGRLPDILFVHSSNIAIIHKDAILKKTSGPKLTIHIHQRVLKNGFSSVCRRKQCVTSCEFTH